ncbi:MAG: hypothetical protein A4E41_01087 [Methanoregulaceae archaeon PtaU1.Bin066]|nr:MAG: hypothetical protein A4E41_01087 [Methanoregulaceae archaeon PtaU1.Bin066]
MTISDMFIFRLTSFITSIGQGDPAMIPVRSVFIEYFGKSGCESSAMNIVGTPCRAVQRSFSTVFSTSRASKVGDGRTIVLPWVMQAMFERTIPKQW